MVFEEKELEQARCFELYDKNDLRRENDCRYITPVDTSHADQSRV